MNSAESQANPVRLLPVIFSEGNKRREGSRPDHVKCIFLLKALRVTQDPKRLAQMLGVKRVAEVYRTLDKLAMRKEYHSALTRLGIDFDYIVRGFKDAADNAPKYSDRLVSLKALLTSVGMDTYKESEDTSGGGWEEILSRKIEETKLLEDAATLINTDYEVIRPVMPANAKTLSSSNDPHH